MKFTALIQLGGSTVQTKTILRGLKQKMIVRIRREAPPSSGRGQAVNPVLTMRAQCLTCAVGTRDVIDRLVTPQREQTHDCNPSSRVRICVRATREQARFPGAHLDQRLRGSTVSDGPPGRPHP